MEIGNQLKEQTAKNVIKCYNDLAKEIKLLNSVNSFDCTELNDQFELVSENLKSLIIEIGAISESVVA
jgi:hypothetical protein